MGLDNLKVFYFVALVVAIILHEISHGVVALWFGDDTAKRAGRITLNPIPHVDPFGSVILPALGALSGIPVIAWAKPVPVNPALVRNRRRNMLWVSLAGPATNFTLAFLAAVVARVLFDSSDVLAVIDYLYVFAFVNLFLGIFNFLPIPPLDGASLIERVLPERWLPGWYRYRVYGFVIVFAVAFFTPILEWIIDPFQRALVSFITHGIVS